MSPKLSSAIVLIILLAAIPVAAQDAAPNLAPAVWLPLTIRTSPPSPVDILCNGDFEGGSVCWEQEGAPIVYCGTEPAKLTIDAFPTPYQGHCWAWMCGYNGCYKYLTSEPFKMPAGYTDLVIEYAYRITSREPGPIVYDDIIGYLRDANWDHVIAVILDKSNNDADGIWHTARVRVQNMDQYAGAWIALEFQGITDRTAFESAFHLDSISVTPSNR